MMQKIFLLKLKSALPADISAIKWLADLLDINETSASRKLKGEIVLKLTELELILEAYPTLIDTLIPQSVKSNTLIGQYISFTNEQDIEH